MVLQCPHALPTLGACSKDMCTPIMLRPSCGPLDQSSRRRRSNKTCCRWYQVVASARCQRVSLHPSKVNELHLATSRIDAEWITAKKDWHEAKRRHKAREKGRPSTSDGPKSQPSMDPSGGGGVRQDASENYQPEMDEMRCILYAHGGWSLVITRLSGYL